MKVRDIIEKLQQFDAYDRVIVGADSECGCCHEPLEIDLEVIEVVRYNENCILIRGV